MRIPLYPQSALVQPHLLRLRSLLTIFLMTLALLLAPSQPIASSLMPSLQAANLSFKEQALTESDGKIAFVSNRDGNYEIYVMNADGMNQTRLTNSTAEDLDPAWSPDGKRLVFYSGRDGNQEIYVMNADGTNQTRLVGSAVRETHPAWSPDGRHIAFVSERDGNQEIYVMNTDGTGQTRLTNNTGNDWHPAWSPDGSRIAFHSDRNGGVNDIYVMNSNGSGEIQLTNDVAHDRDPAWSPDGSRIAFSTERGGNSNVYIMNADGSAQTNLTNDVVKADWPAWSSDGTHIAFESLRDGDYEVYVMNADGSDQTRLTFSGSEDIYPAWEPTIHLNAITPNTTVSNAGNIPIVITGTNLHAPISMQLGNTNLLSVTVETTSTIYAVVPVASLTPGSYDLTATIAGSRVILPDAFTVVPSVLETQFSAMIYLACDNNLEASCAELFNKLELAKSYHSNLRIVVFWDGGGRGDSAYYLIQADTNLDKWGHYTDGVNRFPIGEANTGASSTLVEFAGWAQSHYPGHYKFLSLFGHGGGWAPDLSPGQPIGSWTKGISDTIGGMLWDDHPQSVLATRSLSKALAHVVAAYPIDVLYLDACLMSTVEVLAELTPYANFIVAHENLTWAFTDPYIGYLEGLSTNTDPENLVRHIATVARDSWPATGYPNQISVVRTSSMSQVLVKLDTLAVALMNALPAQRLAIHEAAQASAHVDENSDWRITLDDGYIDAGDFAYQLIQQPNIDSTVKTAAQNLITAIQQATLVNETLSGRPSGGPGAIYWDLDSLQGQSVYFPLTDEWKRDHYSADSLPLFATATHWDDFIQLWYGGQEAPEPPTTPCPKCPVPPMHFSLAYLPLVQRTQ